MHNNDKSETRLKYKKKCDRLFYTSIVFVLRLCGNSYHFASKLELAFEKIISYKTKYNLLVKWMTKDEAMSLY